MTDMTRGPWVANMPADARKPITIETEWRVSETAVGGVIVATVNHHGTGRLQARANARAMAVAPELVDRLERLIPNYVTQHGGVHADASLAHASPQELADMWLGLATLVRDARER